MIYCCFFSTHPTNYLDETNFNNKIKILDQELQWRLSFDVAGIELWEIYYN